MEEEHGLPCRWTGYAGPPLVSRKRCEAASEMTGQPHLDTCKSSVLSDGRLHTNSHERHAYSGGAENSAPRGRWLSSDPTGSFSLPAGASRTSRRKCRRPMRRRRITQAGKSSAGRAATGIPGTTRSRLKKTASCCGAEAQGGPCANQAMMALVNVGACGFLGSIRQAGPEPRKIMTGAVSEPVSQAGSVVAIPEAPTRPRYRPLLAELERITGAPGVLPDQRRQTKGSKTTIEDLALLCANCHRMVHSARPWLTVDELCQLIRDQKKSSHQGLTERGAGSEQQANDNSF
jgi:hypothetical protein